MTKKPSRGIFGYFVLIGTLLLIAILLNGGLNRTVSKRIDAVMTCRDLLFRAHRRRW